MLFTQPPTKFITMPQKNIYPKLLIFSLLLFTYTYSKKNRTLNEIIVETDKYLHTTDKEIRAEKIDSTTPYYCAYAYMTVPINFNDAAPFFMDLENYENLFKYIIDMRQVEDRFNPDDTIYYIEGKTNFIHGWGLGKLTKLSLYPDSLIHMKVRPASQRMVFNYRKERKGKIKYYVRRVYLDGKFIKVDSTHCRIGIRGITSTNKPMPIWIISIIAKVIFPGLLKDAIKSIKKEIKAESVELK